MDSLKNSLELLSNEDETVSVNYWKEVHKELPEILKKVHGIVLVSHNSIEFSEIVGLLKKTRPNDVLNLLYISLIRSYDFMRLVLDKNPIKNKNISFVDCVSGFAFSPQENIGDCLYHPPPQSLNQIKDIMSLSIAKFNPEIIVVDSLTQFINFSNPTENEISEFYKFISSIRTNSINFIQNTFVLFFDTKLDIMKNLPKFSVDLILKVEILKQRSRWID